MESRVIGKSKVLTKPNNGENGISVRDRGRPIMFIDDGSTVQSFF
jgi:hypothetical protein